MNEDTGEFLFRWLDMGQLEALRLWTAAVAATLERGQNWFEFWERLNALCVIEQHRRDDEIQALAETN